MIYWYSLIPCHLSQHPLSDVVVNSANPLYFPANPTVGVAVGGVLALLIVSALVAALVFSMRRKQEDYSNQQQPTEVLVLKCELKVQLDCCLPSIVLCIEINPELTLCQLAENTIEKKTFPAYYRSNSHIAIYVNSGIFVLTAMFI